MYCIEERTTIYRNEREFGLKGVYRQDECNFFTDSWIFTDANSLLCTSMISEVKLENNSLTTAFDFKTAYFYPKGSNERISLDAKALQYDSCDFILID